MTLSLADLIAQKEAIERQIRDAQSSQRGEAIAAIRSLMTQHGLTAADIAAKPAATKGTRSGSKVAAKYRDPQSGATWTGRGLKPKWLAAAIKSGKSLSDFAI
jgi:DNA-binding protein H-NS